MACNVCGEKVRSCENDNCAIDLEGDFYCYEGAHFCSISCWERYLIEIEINNVEEAVDDEKQEKAEQAYQQIKQTIERLFHIDNARDWLCDCGERVNPFSSKFRWDGENWQHHHNYPMGHVICKYKPIEASTADKLTIKHLLEQFITPLPMGEKTRIEGNFEIEGKKFKFKAYEVFSREKGHPNDLIRIDITLE